MNSEVKAKIKKITNIFSKSKLVFGALFTLLGAGFFGNLAFAQNACDISVQFYVTDMNGNNIQSLANKDTRFIMYSKYTVKNNCSMTVKHRFRNVFNDGSYETIGPEQSYTIDWLNKDFASKGYFEFKLPWQTSGLKDNRTKQYVQNNGSIQVASYLATTNGVTITQSDSRLVSVKNEATAPDGQAVVPGNTQGTGQVQIAPEKNKGLVPCGRDSAVTGSGIAGPRPDDTCTVRDLFTLMIRVTNYLILLSGFFATFQIIRSAFSMVLSQGNPEGISGAKKHLVNSILGLVLALMAFILINTVVGLLGLKGGESLLRNPIEYITN